MAESVENKSSLTQKLDEDRRKMAIEVSELKEQYSVTRWLRASAREYPWSWVIGAVLIGFLISRLPARKKEVYVWADNAERKPLRKVRVRDVKTTDKDRNSSTFSDKLWSLAKPILSTYIGRKLYERLA